MTIGERVKKVRKNQGLTLDKFGEHLGVGKTAVSKVENGVCALSDQMARSICREFGINEAWLRDEVGEMKKKPDDIFSEAVADMILEDNPFYDIIKGIVETYAELDPASKQVIHQCCNSLIDRLQKKREGETPSQL